jgi:hypothetical protein
VVSVGIATAALAGGDFCGDQCGAWEDAETTLLCVVDGLGHGRHAAEAAALAVDCVARHRDATLEDILAQCDARLVESRGAAVGLTRIDRRSGTLSYAGIGNIRMLILGAKRRRLPSNPGIVGTGFKALTVQSMSLSPENRLLMFTDGVNELLDLSAYRLPRTAQTLAEEVLRDWSLGTDDAAVLVWIPSID